MPRIEMARRYVIRRQQLTTNLYASVLVGMCVYICIYL